MLLGQDLRGGHQGRLTAVFYGVIHAGGGHHGLAGAHVPLAQAVHGRAGGHIRQGFIYAPALGGSQCKGKSLVKNLHVHGGAGGDGYRHPALSQALEADGEEEQLLKGQPPPGEVQGFRRGWKVDVFKGEARVAQLVVPADAVRQDVRQNGGAGVQSLADGPPQYQLADPGGEGVHGHDAPRDLPPPFRLHHWGDHLPPGAPALGPAVKNVGLSGMEIVFEPRLVEEGDVQNSGLVHRPELHQLHALPDPGDGGRGGRHGRAAGGPVLRQLRDGAEDRAVLVPPGEPGDQIPQGADVQLCQGLGPLFADALDVPHVCCEVRHHNPAFLKNSGSIIIKF